MSFRDGRVEIELVPVVAKGKAYKATEDCGLTSHSHTRDGRIIAYLPDIPSIGEWILLDGHPLPMKVLDVTYLCMAEMAQRVARVGIRAGEPDELLPLSVRED